MKAQAVIHISFSSDERLKIVYHTLKPETKITLTPRSKVRIFRKEKNLTLSFEAKDTSALRAIINSYLRFIYLTQSVMDVVNVV